MSVSFHLSDLVRLLVRSWACVSCLRVSANLGLKAGQDGQRSRWSDGRSRDGRRTHDRTDNGRRKDEIHIYVKIMICEIYI